MNRICDGADDFSQDEHGMPCRCGQSYDDVDRLTIWPHELVGGPGPVIRGDSTFVAELAAHLREVGRARD